MNIAQSIKSYYEHEDFKNNYAYFLQEDFENDEDVIIDRIYNLFNISNYETEKYLTNFKTIDKSQAKKIYDFIYENFEDFIEDFNGCYVGYTSLESTSFGEQEEQIEGLYNHKTQKDYNINYLKKVFESEGFYANDNNYAYYNVDAGLHIDLLANIEILNDFLTTI